jgi:hypothetical protein
MRRMRENEENERQWKNERDENERMRENEENERE